MTTLSRSAALLALVLMSVAPASAATIVLGNEWRDLNETLGLSWQDVESVCSTDGLTPCNGTIGSVDLTGWTWATQDQVVALFREITGLNLNATSNYPEVNSTWAPDILANYFAPTRTLSTSAQAFGWMATIGPPRVFPTGAIAFVSDVFASTGTDRIRVEDFGAAANALTQGGVWLFQPLEAAAPVPEPATLVLLGAGLVGVAARAQRRRQRG